ncbi:MAG: VWA domain-containing protein, partial [Betaproteobacteria bacterium]
LPEDLDFLNASTREARAIREALRPLARKLAARLARKRRTNRDARLDFRRTMRRSLSTGGTPVDLVFRKPHPSRPELIVLADISGSVATFAAFTLQLVYALRTEFTRVRTFVFVDSIVEVTEMMEKAENIVDVTHRINQEASGARIYGGSDYGAALQLFQRRWGEQVRRTSTVIILGDARNNYLAAREESLAAVAERARAVYWLNPESVSSWNDGDSIVRRYAPHCDGFFECRNIRQLRAFVERLD